MAVLENPGFIFVSDLCIQQHYESGLVIYVNLDNLP